MSQPFVGQIIAGGFNFAPVGWLPCDGRVLAISECDVLFHLLGTTYGGDGQTNFALPNLCGRVAVNQGAGAGLSPYALGQMGGAEAVVLAAAQNGAHTHALKASSQTGATNVPGPQVALAQSGQPLVDVYGTSQPNTTLAGTSVGPAGGGQPHENRQPFLTLNYIIAWAGIFPSQN